MKLPPPLMTSDPGSFARHTMVERKPRIIDQVIEDNDFTLDVVRNLEAFRREIVSLPVRLLDQALPGAAFWNRALASHQGRTWLDLPWYFAEAYFYRRLLEIIGYFHPGPYQGYDPFSLRKQKQIELAVADLGEAWDGLPLADPDQAFEKLLHASLWGNRADLSNPALNLGTNGGLAVGDERHNVLIDHTKEAHRVLTAGLGRIDLICDNVGPDLLYDLALIDLALRCGWVRQVVCHLKDVPFFVSDAMPQDLHTTISQLTGSFEGSVRALGGRLRRHLAAESLVLEAGPFWTSYLMFRQFPPDLCESLALADLVIVKGDLNYRRLLDDCRWPHTAPLEEIAAYFPAPFLILRTLKSEIQVGLGHGQAEALAAEDPDWLVNGRRGLIQACYPPDFHDGQGQRLNL